MPPRKGSGDIIIAGTRIKTGFNVVNFADAPYWDASKQCLIPARDMRAAPVVCPANGQMPTAPAKGITKTVRSRPRRIDQKTDRTLKVAAQYLRQFVIHLDGCIDADMCWDVLQNERGLSCHFILDNDGTLYQTLDLIDCAYHAAGLNETSIGIEICNRGDAKYEGDYARQGLRPREVVTCNIHGEKYVALDYTKEQYATMDELAKVLAEVLPGIKLNQPKGSDGVPLWTTIIDELTDPTGARLRDLYTGYLGHYHITKQKWDPGPFDFTKFLSKMRGRSSFPVGLHSLAKKQEVPDGKEALAEAVKAFYRNNEEEGGGGFFPIGPLERYRLWHGGVHLHVPEGEKVYAPWPGQLVAARNVPYQTGIGSVNFVLLKHAFAVKGENLEFYTLFFHLRPEPEDTPKKDRLRWMVSDQWEKRDTAAVRRPVVFDPAQPVQAGEVVGYAGKAGPDDEPQVHFEIFATDFGAVRKLNKGGFWTLVDGSNTRFCGRAEVRDKIDKKKPKGVIDRSELEDFFHEASDDRDFMRQLVTLHPSEWSDNPQWRSELASALDLKLKPKELDEIVKDQIQPTLWWEDVAPRLHLGTHGSDVYTFHPITFVKWLNGLLLEEKSAGSGEVRVATAADRKDAAEGRTGKAKQDFEDKSGESFVNEDDLKDIAPDKKLEIEDIIEGFGD